MMYFSIYIFAFFIYCLFHDQSFYSNNINITENKSNFSENHEFKDIHANIDILSQNQSNNFSTMLNKECRNDSPQYFDCTQSSFDYSENSEFSSTKENTILQTNSFKRILVENESEVLHKKNRTLQTDSITKKIKYSVLDEIEEFLRNENHNSSCNNSPFFLPNNIELPQNFEFDFYHNDQQKIDLNNSQLDFNQSNYTQKEENYDAFFFNMCETEQNNEYVDFDNSNNQYSCASSENEIDQLQQNTYNSLGNVHTFSDTCSQQNEQNQVVRDQILSFEKFFKRFVNLNEGVENVQFEQETICPNYFDYYSGNTANFQTSSDESSIQPLESFNHCNGMPQFSQTVQHNPSQPFYPSIPLSYNMNASTASLSHSNSYSESASCYTNSLKLSDSNLDTIISQNYPNSINSNRCDLFDNLLQVEMQNLEKIDFPSNHSLHVIQNKLTTKQLSSDSHFEFISSDSNPLNKLINFSTNQNIEIWSKIQKLWLFSFPYMTVFSKKYTSQSELINDIDDACKNLISTFKIIKKSTSFILNYFKPDFFRNEFYNECNFLIKSIMNMNADDLDLTKNVLINLHQKNVNQIKTLIRMNYKTKKYTELQSLIIEVIKNDDFDKLYKKASRQKYNLFKNMIKIAQNALSSEIEKNDVTNQYEILKKKMDKDIFGSPDGYTINFYFPYSSQKQFYLDKNHYFNHQDILQYEKRTKYSSTNNKSKKFIFMCHNDRLISNCDQIIDSFSITHSNIINSFIFHNNKIMEIQLDEIITRAIGLFRVQTMVKQFYDDFNSRNRHIRKLEELIKRIIVYYLKYTKKLIIENNRFEKFLNNVNAEYIRLIKIEDQNDLCNSPSEEDFDYFCIKS